MSAILLALAVLFHPLPDSGGIHSSDTLELGMKSAVQLLLRNNQALGAARYEIEASKGDLKSAGLIPNPQLSVNGSYVNLLKHPVDYNSTQTAARIDQIFELGGKREYRVETGEHSVAETEDEFLDTRHQLVDDFRETFLSAAFAEQAYLLARENLEISSKLKDVAAKRLEAGDIGEQEFIEIKLEDMKVEQNLSDAKQMEYDSFSKIRRTLNLDPNITLKISYDFSPAFSLPPEDSLTNIAFKERSDLLAEQEKVLIQSNKVKLAKANGIPDLDIGVELDRQGPAFADTFGGGFGIAIPLFNRNQGEIETAQAQQSEEEFLLRAKENEVINEVKTTYAKYENSVEVLHKLSPSTMSDAREVREMAVKSYTSGNIGLVELLQAEQVYTDAVQSYYNALQEFFINRIELERAVGIEIFEEDMK